LRSLIGVLCLALLVLRVGGVHLHLCFDGSEPPLSYHLADSGVHHLDEDHLAGEPHSDRDLELAADLTVKKSFNDSLAPFAVFALALLLFWVAPGRGERPRAREPIPSFRDFRWRRPPLRGPPLPA
jgi:hypothetical protein